MTKKFKGKTLLVLGSNVGATDIVQYAKENGAYTIVADYYPKEQSAAKQISDAHVLVSTGDLKQLEQLIYERKIDGILAGISEFNLLNACELSQRAKLPFYFNMEQWNSIEKKSNFRILCEKHAVPCPKTYFIGAKIKDEVWGKISYPAVIKPVDASSSKGVFICKNEFEMKRHEPDAFQQSSCGELIIEEYALGDEFTAHYTIANGQVSLSSVDNRYPVTVHEGDSTTVPVARIYPCLFLDEYLKQINAQMINLCNDIGLSNAIIFIQGLYNKEKNCFYIFEAGLRSAGEAPYRFIKKINGVNAMHVLVDHAMSVPSEFASELEDPAMKNKCCGIVSFITIGGVVGSINGLEEAVAATPSVIEYESRYPVGSETPNGRTLRQLMIRFVMVCDSREKMEKDISYLNDHITILDEFGHNMIIKMDSKRLFDTK